MIYDLVHLSGAPGGIYFGGIINQPRCFISLFSGAAYFIKFICISRNSMPTSVLIVWLKAWAQKVMDVATFTDTRLAISLSVNFTPSGTESGSDVGLGELTGGNGTPSSNKNFSIFLVSARLESYA